ncbi:MAG: ATP-dependent DNA helicase [Candidatus Omnitrophota bacterium]
MDNFLKHYRQLNKEQALAVDATEGPFLVLAGPGTGKTQLLSVRAAAIVRKKRIDPGRILVLTYTNAAVRAMKERLADILGAEGYDVEVATFHSFANSIIQESEEAVSYVQEKIQISDVEKVKCVEYILDSSKGLDDIRPFGAPYFYRQNILNNIRDLKNEGISPDDFVELMRSVKPDGIRIEEKHITRLGAFSNVYRRYEELKSSGNSEIFDERGRYDYEDMIIIAKKAIQNEPALREKYAKHYRYVMVDEFQDTNGAQLSLLLSMIDPGGRPNLCCVGDDDQAIYRFQGASVGNFNRLKEAISGVTAITLTDNYRSAKQLIGLSSKIIGQIPAEHRCREKKLVSRSRFRDPSSEFYEFSSEDEEITFIVNRIETIKDEITRSEVTSDEEKRHPYNNIAVLVRKRKYMPKIANAFIRAGIPYATDGKEDIRNERRVRQLLDALELAHVDIRDTSSRDLALYKVLSSDYFNIPYADILRFIGWVNAKRLVSAKGNKNPRGLPGTLFEEFLRSFTAGRNEPPTERETGSLAIVQKLDFLDPRALHRAAWAVTRLTSGARSRPVHDILLGFVKDAGIFNHIVQRYDSNKVIKINELRALTSFINMVKNSDLSKPGVGLDDFMEEVDLREKHGLPLTGDLVTATQDGVRVYTAHGTKGLEFYGVIIPFCLQKKSWPIKPWNDLIPLPPSIFTSREMPASKAESEKLLFHDEARLFYVAATRAKACLIFTASPQEKETLTPFAAAMNIKIDRQKDVPEEKVISDYMSAKIEADPVDATAGIIRDAAAHVALTPTKLNNYLRCRRRFFYDNILQLPGQKKQSLIYGNCAHNTLEVCYRKYMCEDRLPGAHFFIAEFKAELARQGVSRSIAAGCMNKLDRLVIWYKRSAQKPVKPISLENKLIVTAGDGIVFTGKYDKIEFEDARRGIVRVIDYKTGKPDKHIKKLSRPEDLASEECDDYLRQLVAYKLLYENSGGVRENYRVQYGVLEFLEPVASTVIKYGLKKDEYRSEKIEITDEQVARLREIIIECWKNIQSLRFEKLDERNEEKCGHCDFNDICWSKEEW